MSFLRTFLHNKALYNPNSMRLQFLKTSASSSSSDYTGPQAKFFPAIKTPMLPAGTFNGKVVLITGGGTGLGKGMATFLSSLGATVVIAARRLNVLENTAKEISAKTGNVVVPLQLDIRDPTKVKEAFDLCEEKVGLPSIVINNSAGNFISPTERLSPNAWKTIIDIVLNGTANVTLEAGKRMIKAKTGGVFLSITTPYTRSGSGFVSPSASAKSGVQTLMRSLSSEWGRYGMRFNCLAPGSIETEGAFSRLDPTGEFRKQAFKRTPVGRMGEVEELANLASYLVSDYSSWMSGETVTFDGGSYRFLAGSFNRLADMPHSHWDEMEKMIKKSSQEQSRGVLKSKL